MLEDYAITRETTRVVLNMPRLKSSDNDGIEKFLKECMANLESKLDIELKTLKGFIGDEIRHLKTDMNIKLETFATKADLEQFVRDRN